jgi:uncharacterized protein (TIGR03086 family)
MTGVPATAQFTDEVGLLERAVSYALGAVRTVTDESLSWPTPCSQWDVLALVRHLNDSLAVLFDGIDAGSVDARGCPDGGVDRDPVGVFRERASRLMGGWARAGEGVIRVSECPMTASMMAAAGSVEIAVHGWDVAQAVGEPRPIPYELAVSLLEVVPLVVSEQDRPGLFGPRVLVSGGSGASDRLLGYLGRTVV